MESESPLVPVGYRFEPRDDEMITHYLLKKVRGELFSSNLVKDVHLYGDKAPWQVFPSSETEFYVFTTLKKITKNRISRTAGCGTWHGQDSGSKIFDRSTNSLIGLKKLFNFKIKNRHSGWLMHEFSLAGVSLSPQQPSEYVLCRITKKESNPRNKDSYFGCCLDVETKVHLENPATEIVSESEQENPPRKKMRYTCNTTTNMPTSSDSSEIESSLNSTIDTENNLIFDEIDPAANESINALYEYLMLDGPVPLQTCAAPISQWHEIETDDWFFN